MSQRFLQISVISHCEEIETQLASLPQDHSQGYPREIAEKVRTGIATVHQISRDGVNVGYFITEKFENDFVVLAMQTFQNIDAFHTILENAETLARNAGCRHLTFNTIRAGLLERAIDFKFQISTVTLRKTL